MDWNISTTISGPTIVGLLGIIGGIIGLMRLVIQTKRSAARVETKVDPVSNGFTEDVMKRFDALDKRLDDHIAWHLNMRKGN